MTKKQFLLATFFAIFTFSVNAQLVQDLAGQWQVRLDENNELLKDNLSNLKTEGEINLPGSLAENGFGLKTKGSDFGILTPEYKYVGKAWYSKEITIPKNWTNRELEINLERVLWESHIIIDGIELSRQDGLGTPHVHRIAPLKPGKHQLTILVDNEMIHNIGDKGHAYGEYTQSIWNGIVGGMQLKALSPSRIEMVRTFPDIEKDVLNLKVKAKAKDQAKAQFAYEIVSVKTGDVALAGEFEKEIGDKHFDVAIPADGKLQKWSEFTPETYLLKIKLKDGKNEDIYETEFGFYQVSQNGTKILINNQPVFLRGNLDCVHFPLTGYPSCKLEDWIKIFKTYKDYGLNHARFHSWCPPEAAFKAANRVGIYLQAEASIWIDWWMSTDMVSRGRPEMDTKGHPKGLGHDAKRDSFVVAEMHRMEAAYGNHPSYTMFCIGNELGNSDFDVMKKWVDELKQKDTRRLYAVSTARKITDVDDYCATHYIAGVGRTRGLNGATTNWDFEKSYGQMNIPIIAHEIGQWPVYPRWTEIAKYSGVLKARNFEEFKAQAEKNGIVDQADDFANASGALNQIMYKYETESFLRTPSCAGVQLLSMQDYQGQGEALIGWLDSHWESKGIVTPEEFRTHYDTTVCLLRMDKFIWTNNETYTATAQLSHHGSADINGFVKWKISSDNGKTLSAGEFNKQAYKVGTLTVAGEISFDLQKIKTAKQLIVSLELQNSAIKNEWKIWVYPEENSVEINDVIEVDQLNEKAISALKNGQKVLLTANELGTDSTSVKAHFYPLYWSLTFFPGQGKTCIGLLLKDKHPLFKKFPTSFHSDWQWEYISNDAKGFVLNDLPYSYQAIAQPVDDFHRNNKVGSIFELKVGEGKLLVCGYNLNNTENLVARQLKKSILNYMNSENFNPEQDVQISWLKQLFPVIPKVKTVELPDEFKNAILYVEAGAKLSVDDEQKNWHVKMDSVKVSEETSYRTKAVGTINTKTVSGWFGKEIQIQMNCQDGILGTFYFQLQDKEKKKLKGLLEFEGRKVIVDSEKNQQWIEFHVMREDSNDGKLLLNVRSKNGSELVINKIVLVKE